jgi:hypothetical protein
LNLKEWLWANFSNIEKIKKSLQNGSFLFIANANKLILGIFIQPFDFPFIKSIVDNCKNDPDN